MSLIVSLRSEILKTKRTAAFYFTLIGAAVVPVVFLLNVLLDPDEMDATRKDPMNAIFKITAEMNGFMIFPLFVVLVCTLLPQIEFRNNTWKQVLTSPQTKGNVFIGKFLNIQLLVLLFLVATHLFVFMTMVATHFIKPELDLLNQPFQGRIVVLRAVNAYVTILAVCSLQFWLGLRFRNFIVPVAIGLVCWLTGMILIFQYNSAFANYFPYSFQVFPLSPKHIHVLNQVKWTSLCYAVLFVVLGFIDFRGRRMNG